MAMCASKRSAEDSISNALLSLPQPRLVIVTQPQRYGFRFRYESENRASTILGAGSTNDHKNYVTVKLVDCEQVKVVVSCVTSDEPYTSHPHQLNGKNCKKGVFRGLVKGQHEFRELGIKCVKKENMERSLNLRKSLKVDPFKNGYTVSRSNLSVVRLCFQAFIQIEGEYSPLAPVVSEPIFDNKKYEQLSIMRVSCNTGPANGGTGIMIFCSKLEKASASMEFMEKGDDNVKATVRVLPQDVHNQIGVYFTTPKYWSHLTAPHEVNYQLCCGNQKSDIQEFIYEPSDEVIQSATRGHSSLKKSKVVQKTSAPYIPTVLFSDSLESTELPDTKVEAANHMIPELAASSVPTAAYQPESCEQAFQIKDSDSFGIGDVKLSLHSMSLEDGFVNQFDDEATQDCAEPCNLPVTQIPSEVQDSQQVPQNSKPEHIIWVELADGTLFSEN